MYITTRSRRSNAFRHSQVWAGMLLVAICAGLGDFAGGAYFGHPGLGAAAGGAVGGFLMHRVRAWIEQRDARTGR